MEPISPPIGTLITSSPPPPLPPTRVHWDLQ
nr:MAG TPA: protein of unknown function (DUF5558) [Caudoviricetes sp.]